MPNTKSAERRMRNSSRRRLHNQEIKSELKTLERRFTEKLKAPNKEEAKAALSTLTSALDKAAKRGVIHRANADRKKSRLAVQVK